MRRFTVIVLILIAIIWLLKLFLPEPKPAVSAAPRSLVVADPAPITPAPAVYAPPAHAPKAKTQHKTGPCQNPDDRAADGSRCGSRAASVLAWWQIDGAGSNRSTFRS